LLHQKVCDEGAFLSGHIYWAFPSLTKPGPLGLLFLETDILSSSIGATTLGGFWPAWRQILSSSNGLSQGSMAEESLMVEKYG